MILKEKDRIGEGKRQDWGFVQIALRNGEDVHILQATNSELEYYEKKLQRFKDNMNNEEKKERVVVSQTAKPNVLI